jgi:uncharacterized membrane protein YtjA (UPF0391 family)
MASRGELIGFLVMAGLVPAIHVFVALQQERRGCPAAQTSLRSLRKLDCGAGHDDRCVCVQLSRIGFGLVHQHARNQTPAGRLLVRQLPSGETAMSLLKWALIFLVISLIAALFGFGGVAAASADIARVLFYIFLVIFLVLLVLGLMGARAARGS